MNNIEVITPRDKEHWLELRAKDLTSTEVSALFGLSPYSSKFEVWHNHKDGIVTRIEENERMKWGTRLESAIAAGIAEEQGWDIRAMKEYIREPNLRMGSSFDYSIEAEEKGILEIKNVDGLAFRNNWLIDDDGNIEAPPHIELQVQHQMLVSQRKYAYIGALVGGNDVKLIRRDADQDIQFSIIAEVRKFWESIDAGIAPDPDFKTDAEFIAKLYSYAAPGKIVDRYGDAEVESLVDQYKVVSAQIKEFEEQKQSIKAQLLMNIGDAEKATGKNFTISAGLIGPSTFTVERKGYRNFKVSTKKEAK